MKDKKKLVSKAVLVDEIVWKASSVIRQTIHKKVRGGMPNQMTQTIADDTKHFLWIIFSSYGSRHYKSIPALSVVASAVNRLSVHGIEIAHKSCQRRWDDVGCLELPRELKLMTPAPSYRLFFTVKEE
ncbi:hypothetical protein CEXT_355981 [Caerostris extrusa]|uniref:Uncharacterized protein n=1 Tax=Caerostris extrusa TaxID=172846 RepID=A0AAV4QYC0_CAEEX|nr:hypothetical protein CEXT_355981 [Caerostris extrusa]